MFAIIGMLLVLAAVVGGYLMEHGQLMVLVQPAELVIIGGAAIGTLLIGNPLSTVIAIGKRILGIVKPSPYTKKFYLETLQMFDELFSSARKLGVTKLEADIEDPANSPVFSKYPKFLKHKKAVDFVCDTIRTHLTGGIMAHDLDALMELDIDIQQHESAEPVHALSTVADALPGLGIVAAVLGVVITMGSLGGPPEEIGHKVAAALVGTFLGILLCYGFLSPLAANIMKQNEAETQYFNCLRSGVIAYVRGAAPVLAVEFSRRSIPAHERPSFKDLEVAVKGSSAEVPAESQAAAG
ncbi:MAG: flagellar motor stator protein MotA [Bryobacteraceae bacterium]